MRKVTIYTAWLAASLIIATTASAITVAYGRRDIEQAGAGCVAGWISGHGNIAYFRGDTDLLNRQLETIAQTIPGDCRAKVVLHTGNGTVEDPYEQPATTLGERKPGTLNIDWSVRKFCYRVDILSGHCKCDRRLVTVDVWIAKNIELDSLSIPADFAVESGGEIESFVDRRNREK